MNLKPIIEYSGTAVVVPKNSYLSNMEYHHLVPTYIGIISVIICVSEAVVCCQAAGSM